MKALILGAIHLKGVSEKGAYDFGNVFVGSEVESGVFGTATIRGYGLKVVELALADGAIAAFAPFVGKYPLMLELEMGVEVKRGKFETVCTGVKTAATAAVQPPKIG